MSIYLLKALIAVSLLVVVIYSIFLSPLSDYFTLEYIQEKQGIFENYYSVHPLKTIFLFMGVYAVLVTFSIPVATLLTILAGALFGVGIATLVVLTAGTIGAVGAFLLSRQLIGSVIQKKYDHQLKKINEGLEREGAFYLFFLRLVPLFPFFLINLCMGLTNIKTHTYALVTFIGILPAVVVGVYLGTTLATLTSLEGQFPFSLLIALILVGSTPLILKRVIGWIRRRRLSQ